MKLEHKCRIVSKETLGDAIFMVLEVGDMVRTSFRAPGQFVHINCGQSRLLRRPISVCSCQEDTPEDTLSIAFEVRGEGTAWLAGRPVGHSVDVLGLLGNGFDINPEGRYLLVGGGIGVPPMRGCAQYTGGRSTAVLGFRSKEKAALLDIFVGDCAKILVDRAYDGVLACGPKPMLRSVAKAAAESGVPCQVSMEERMGCGVGACLVCACDMADGTRKHVCKDGPVFDSREVNWAA